MRRTLVLFMAGFTALGAGACASTGLPIAEPAGTSLFMPVKSVPAAPAFRETGMASWYGTELHGRATASGIVFDMNGLSAAHRTLPLGTVVRVTNLETYKSVTVTVTDRGPLLKGHVIDLSYGAAKDLGFVEQGTVPVRLETDGPVPAEGTWTVLAAIFAEEENARVLKYRLSRRYEVVAITSVTNNIGTFYRVRVGNYPTEEKAERIAAKLTREGLEPLVLRKD